MIQTQHTILGEEEQKIEMILIFLLSFTFEARPKPDNTTWYIKGDVERVIPVYPNKNTVSQNYVVYPLEQVKIIIANIFLILNEGFGIRLAINHDYSEDFS